MKIKVLLKRLKHLIKRWLYDDAQIEGGVPHSVNIGVDCEIMKGVNFGSEPWLITLGNNVRVASGVKFLTHDGGMWVLRNMRLMEDADYFGQIKVGNNVHIGMNAIILPNVTIGDNCIVGVGAIVTKNVPNHSVVAGVPARIIESIEEYYEKHIGKVDFTKHMSVEEKKVYLKAKYKLEGD